jgi:hypothetical protein
MRLYRVSFANPDSKELFPEPGFSITACDVVEAERSARDALNIPARYRAEVREA